MIKMPFFREEPTNFIGVLTKGHLTCSNPYENVLCCEILLRDNYLCEGKIYAYYCYTYSTRVGEIKYL